MDKKNTLLVVVLLVLVSVYAVFFTDWFKPRVIKLFYTTRPLEHFRARQSLPYVLFGLEGRYQLTELKIVPLDDPAARPVWHLISDSNSVPLKMFTYGEYIHGMRPEYKGERAGDLVTNKTYRLFVSAGRAHGQVDFTVK
ncbi:MAG TPA: hypothetical protein VH280_02460 [Verrucomicrobiae bacterium]|jgi:hypothetical protein|nr:hypothetical protein [Verrucomicrobiae bacterium]